MKELVKKMDEYCEKNNVNYIWTIFTNNLGAIDSKNIAYMKPRLDIRNYLADADYVVQLSDNVEGYNYTVNEALALGTPVVITPCNVYKELGITKKMSIQLDFDLSNIDSVVKQIFTKKITVDYTPKEDRWNELLVESESTYKEDIKKKYLVKATIQYSMRGIEDSELNRIPERGEEFIVDYNRKEILTGGNKYDIEFVEVVKEIEGEV